MTRVEFLAAYEDNTWGTVIWNVPVDTKEREQLVAWAERNLSPLTRYREVVMWGLYSIHDDVLVECPSCRGYGHFDEDGEPVLDKNERKCTDCTGTGQVPFAG